MAIKNKTGLTNTNATNITDQLNGQNTAADVREVTQDIIDSTVNMLDSNFNLGQTSTVSGSGNVAAGTNTVGGSGNTVGGSGNTVGGSNNNVSGSGNSQPGSNSVVGGVGNSISDGTASVFVAGQRASVTHGGELSMGAGRLVDGGGSQMAMMSGFLSATCYTVDSTPVDCGAFGDPTSPITIETDSVYRIRMWALAVNTGSGAGTKGATACFTGSGTVKNVAGTVSIVNASPQKITMTQGDADATMTGTRVDVTVQAGVGLKVSATGISSGTIAWTVRVDFEKITF